VMHMAGDSVVERNHPEQGCVAGSPNVLPGPAAETGFQEARIVGCNHIKWSYERKACRGFRRRRAIGRLRY
jgi:hypothetical protein